MSKIKVIVIDDERSSREELRRAIKKYADFEVIGEAKNADEAKELIEAQYPDLIFLDIQMPEKSGFDLLESMEVVPQVIFTTAFNQYAVQAFEINALDYLMKPIREERFTKAVEKIRERIIKKSVVSNPITANRQIFIKDGEKCHFVWLSEIYLIESMDNYSKLYFESKKAFIKRSLNQWEEILDPTLFFRISRTQIINTQHIKQVHPMSKGKLQISLKTGELLDVSSRQSVKFKNLKGI
jgi:two-component system, LytTR family, response regulator